MKKLKNYLAFLFFVFLIFIYKINSFADIVWQQTNDFKIGKEAYSKENWERLMDNVLEYEEIYDLTKHFNPIIKEAWAKYEKQILDINFNIDELDLAYRKLCDLEELAKSEQNKEMNIFYKAQKNILNNARRNIINSKNKLTYFPSKKNEALRLATKNLAFASKNLMLSYKSLEKQEKLSRQIFELNEQKLEAIKLQKQLGLEVQSSLNKANTELLKAKAYWEELSNSKEKQRIILIKNFSWDLNANPQIKDIVGIDIDFLDNRNLQEDIKKAESTNQDLISFRNSRKNSSTYANNIAKLKEDELENNHKIDMLALYNKLKEAKANYEANKLSYEAMKMNFSAMAQLKVKNAISNLNYLEEQIELMKKESEYQTSLLNLYAVIEEYKMHLGIVDSLAHNKK